MTEPLGTIGVQSSWGSPCTDRNPNGDAMITIWSVIDDWFLAYGYVPRPGYTSAANCRNIAGSKVRSIHSWYDDHRYTFRSAKPGAPVTIKVAAALDVNSDRNPMGSRLVTDMPIPMIDKIEAVRTNTGKQVVVWGGYWTRPDAMHFQPGCTPADIRSGINPATLPNVNPPAQEINDMLLVSVKDGPYKGMVFEVDATSFRWVDSGLLLDEITPPFPQPSPINGAAFAWLVKGRTQVKVNPIEPGYKP